MSFCKHFEVENAGNYYILSKKDKSDEKLADTEEDKLETRTDGSDASDVLCIGAETKRVLFMSSKIRSLPPRKL